MLFHVSQLTLLAMTKGGMGEEQQEEDESEDKGAVIAADITGP